MMKKIFAAIGFVSGIITIAQAVDGIVNQKKLVITPQLTFWAIIFFVSLLIFIVGPNKRLWYTPSKYISFWIRRPDLPYHLKKKEIIYTYDSLESMKYQKNITLVPKVDGFSQFKSKFRWSKAQELSDFNVKCLSPPNAKLFLGRDTTWYTYTVSFLPSPKNQAKDINILIDNLSDPNREALPFCSASIVECTERLIIRIRLNKNLKIDIASVRFLVYDNGASTFPILEEGLRTGKKLHYKKPRNKKYAEIYIEEQFPVYGYKYQISWKFK